MDKLEAIALILQGVDCLKVVKTVGDISVALGAFETLKPERTA